MRLSEGPQARYFLSLRILIWPFTGQQEQVVMEYKSGDYFGELALLKDEPRAASIQAKTDCRVVGLDRESFKRLIVPLDEILKRNMAKYQKYM